MALDPQFKAMLEEEARTAPELPPLDTLPPDLIRAGYRAQRAAQNAASTPAGVDARDLTVEGAAGGGGDGIEVADDGGELFAGDLVDRHAAI